jgi:signal transduction histidine kinase
MRFFAPSQLFKHVADRHEHDTRARNITVRTLVDDAADQIFADPDRLDQVIENLFANALRHTPDGGVVELHATTSNKSVVLRVVDSGDGIPPEHLPYVFERFYKADPARARGDGGSGLGLSIARTIVERHMGMISADSRPGHTVFTIVLPRASAQSLDVGELVTHTPGRKE